MESQNMDELSICLAGWSKNRSCVFPDHSVQGNRWID